MSLPGDDNHARLAAVQREFDAAFAAPPAPPPAARENLLLIGAGTQHYALRMSELAGLQKLPRCVALPGARHELLGLCGVSGRLVAVYSLARLLGHDSADAQWLVLAGGDRSIGLAFDHFAGQRTPLARDLHDADGATRRETIRQLASLDGAFVPVLHLPTLVRDLLGASPASPLPETPAGPAPAPQE